MNTKLLYVTLMVMLNNCASVSKVRESAKMEGSWADGLTCIDSSKDPSNVGESLARELELRFNDSGYKAQTLDSSAQDCKRTIKLVASTFGDGYLGNVFVTLADAKRQKLREFKFENSARNCCYNGPESASEKIFATLVQ